MPNADRFLAIFSIDDPPKLSLKLLDFLQDIVVKIANSRLLIVVFADVQHQRLMMCTQNSACVVHIKGKMKCPFAEIYYPNRYLDAVSEEHFIQESEVVFSCIYMATLLNAIGVSSTNMVEKSDFGIRKHSCVMTIGQMPVAVNPIWIDVSTIYLNPTVSGAHVDVPSYIRKSVLLEN